MSTSETFKEFLASIKISDEKAEDISCRYGRITRALNLKFRDTDSKTANSLQVGSMDLLCNNTLKKKIWKENYYINVELFHLLANVNSNNV